jgi:hypothetical protein
MAWKPPVEIHSAAGADLEVSASAVFQMMQKDQALPYMAFLSRVEKAIAAHRWFLDRLLSQNSQPGKVI